MNVADLGSRFLGEVEECNLHEIFQILRSLNNLEPLSGLGVPPLDRLVSIFDLPSTHNRDIHEQHVSLRGTTQTTSPRRQARRSATIELTSSGPGAGKTHLLYHIITVAVLPDSHDGIALNGKRGAVVVFDTDGRFDVSRLVQVMEHYILNRRRAATQQSNDSDADATRRHIYTALQHIHIFRPQSLQSLLASLAALPSYLLDATAHRSSNRHLVAILLDSASAFFWQAKADEENSRSAESATPAANAAPAPRATDQYVKLVHHLRALQKTFECAVVATTWGLAPADSGANAAASFRPHLPPAWSSFVALRLVVERDAVAKFAPGMSAEEAGGDKQARRDAVAKGSFSAWVDAWGSEGWSDAVREALKRGNGGFGFVISGEGVVVSE